MLYKRNQLPELYTLKHRHDDGNSFVDYENIVLDKSLSPYLYENNTMSNYLKRLQPAVSILFDHMNLIKNFKNYIVDKYDYRQRG
jgi:hypothetical protein